MGVFLKRWQRRLWRSFGCYFYIKRQVIVQASCCLAWLLHILCHINHILVVSPHGANVMTPSQQHKGCLANKHPHNNKVVSTRSDLVRSDTWPSFFRHSDLLCIKSHSDSDSSVTHRHSYVRHIMTQFCQTQPSFFSHYNLVALFGQEK